MDGQVKLTWVAGLPVPVLTGCDLKVSLLMRPRMLLILFACYAFLFPRTTENYAVYVPPTIPTFLIPCSCVLLKFTVDSDN